MNFEPPVKIHVIEEIEAVKSWIPHQELYYQNKLREISYWAQSDDRYLDPNHLANRQLKWEQDKLRLLKQELEFNKKVLDFINSLPPIEQLGKFPLE